MACSELSLINLALQQPEIHNELAHLKPQRNSLEEIVRLQSLKELLASLPGLVGWDWPLKKAARSGIETALVRRAGELADQAGPLQFDPVAVLKGVRTPQDAAFYLQFQELPAENRLRFLKAWRLANQIEASTYPADLLECPDLPTGLRQVALAKKIAREDERAQASLVAQPKPLWQQAQELQEEPLEERFEAAIRQEPELADWQESVRALVGMLQQG